VKVVYKLALPQELASVHNVIHVFMPQKYVSDLNYVLDYTPLHVHENLSYIEYLVHILGRKEQTLRSTIIYLVNILWQHHSEQEATWEREEEMTGKYPHLFQD